MFDMFRPQQKRVYLQWPYQWPYRENHTVVDRHYCILAPVVCTSGCHVFMGNPNAINAVCSEHKKGK